MNHDLPMIPDDGGDPILQYFFSAEFSRDLRAALRMRRRGSRPLTRDVIDDLRGRAFEQYLDQRTAAAGHAAGDGKYLQKMARSLAGSAIYQFYCRESGEGATRVERPLDDFPGRECNPAAELESNITNTPEHELRRERERALRSLQALIAGWLSDRATSAGSVTRIARWLSRVEGRPETASLILQIARRGQEMVKSRELAQLIQAMRDESSPEAFAGLARTAITRPE